MDREQWRRLEEVFRSAQTQEPGSRNAFLDAACQGDEELRREVELLLANPPKSGPFDATARTVPTIIGHPRQTGLIADSYLGPYQILSVIGSGGMGEVYRAHDPRLGRDVAIKVPPERLSRDPQALARFEREARAVAALSHPNIIAIFDVGRDQGVSYIVTELLEGESLGARIRRGKMPWREAVDVGIAVAEALTAAHPKGLTHRDLKPDNVFLTADGRVKLLDFGVARFSPEVLGEEHSLAETLTLAGTILGTVGYMSPEQVRGEVVDPRSDIFSLGCVLFEMVSGRRPFHRASQAETIAAVLMQEPAALSESGASVPFDLERLVGGCLEKNPQNRFQSARAVVAALTTLKEHSGNLDSTSSVAMPGDAAIDSIAVLPFWNASDNPELQYLTDGITESLINSLSQLRDIRVVARSTVFKYKAREIDPEVVGRALNVRAVLMGRVMQRGEALNVQSELVDIRKGSQIWGEQYNHKPTDIFVVQEVIAREITKKLRVKLSQEQKKRLTRRYTENSEAYQVYLRGRFYWNKRTPEGMRKAIDHFQLAIRQDPGYALAYAGLADCFTMLASYHLLAPGDAFAKAKSMASRALEIDKSLAEAHASLGYTRAFYDWDWAGAQLSFRRAIELSPSYGTAYHWRTTLFSALGRIDEAFSSVRKGLDVDPLSLPLNAQLAFTLHLARRYDEAVEQGQKTLEMDPSFALAQFFLGLSYVQRRDFDEAIASFQKAHELTGIPLVLGGLGHACAVAGRTDQARRTIAQLIEAGKERYVAPFSIALVHIGLNEFDQAFEWMQNGLEDRSWWLSMLKMDPAFDPVRSDPRFQVLTSHLHMP
jgi:serine/threonine protein kinase/Tfp pilus assembly protein PilF